MNVLIIDDQASQRAVMRRLVEDIGPEIWVTDFSDPVQALDWSQEERPDLIILDYRMPNMDGLEFARRFRRPLAQRDVPIMLVTVADDAPVRQAALDAGAIDFMVKPIRPRELRARCKNLLDLRRRQLSLQSRTESLQQRLLVGLNEAESRERELVCALARAGSLRDGSDPYHLQRVSHYSGLLAEGIGWADPDVHAIELAATVHDIGHLALPDELLGLDRAYDAGQRARMQAHAELGFRILSASSSPFLSMCAQIALGHHERWDGSGYPHGLSGQDVPVAARIVALADCLDALSTARAYRPALDWEAALALVRSQSGQQFDPELVAVLDRRADEFAGVLPGLEPPAPGGILP